MVFECMLRLRAFLRKFFNALSDLFKNKNKKIKTGFEILLSLTKTNDDGVHNRSCSIDWDENTLINASAITGALPIKAYQ